MALCCTLQVFDDGASLTFSRLDMMVESLKPAFSVLLPVATKSNTAKAESQVPDDQPERESLFGDFSEHADGEQRGLDRIR